MTQSEFFIQAMKTHLSKLSQRSRLAYLVHLLWGVPFLWGQESLSGTDCSGTISWALYLMGFNIRTTAHGYFIDMTTDMGSDVPIPGDLCFWWNKDQTKIKHVAMYTNNGCILDADFRNGMQIISVDDEIATRPNLAPPINRRLNWKAIGIIAEKGRQAWGVDTELKPLFAMFSEDALDT